MTKNSQCRFLGSGSNVKLLKPDPDILPEQFNQMRIKQADKIEGAFERAIQGISVHKIEKEEHDES